ncbi:DUF4123 domain-containing protein [Paraburkholderia megapolitana]|uniref:DUF4123 domain-containing protein n=1 Tax=Paraburkholderia megapolitana TaxID=420953 RepID=A0A1I3URM2_9BURK|nr:DUF4123 domain-containing protein [Paraburkholderia megapolitana]QDQ82322.1 DUF4123 domain-containing protein [Paraburkholderia megapolitana]SFJ85419.1 protein of unknown function [Paraburkholderia megapolitana]
MALPSNESGLDEDLSVRVDRMVNVLRAYFAAHPETHCLLAVDPGQRALRDRPQAGVLFSEQPVAAIKIDHDAFPVEHRPYLMELDLSTKVGVTLLSESVRLAFDDRDPERVAQGQGQRIGAWLASTVSAQALAAYWAQHVLQTDDLDRKCVLRFYDARALSLIWPILSSGQQQVLLGPVIAWHALDASARPCVYTAHRALQSDLALTREQWQSIHRHGFVNRALGLHMEAMERQPLPQEVETAVASAARADVWLVDPDDKVAFIGHALTWHPQFDRYPKVNQMLRQLSEDDFYTGAISALSLEEIAEIQSGSWLDEKTVSPDR